MNYIPEFYFLTKLSIEFVGFEDLKLNLHSIGFSISRLQESLTSDWDLNLFF